MYNIFIARRIMFLCICHLWIYFFSSLINATDATSFSSHRLPLFHTKHVQIMTMGNDNSAGIPPPAVTIAPSEIPAGTQVHILTPSPTIPAPNPTRSPSTPTRLGAVKAIEKCNEYHDWLIKRATFQFFIIKGTPAIGKEFPHMAALGYGNEDNIQWLCGGSLVSEQYVLTAGHCLRSMEMGNVRWVRLGDNNLNSSNSETVQMFSVKESIAHPGYSAISKYNDIALLKLDRPVDFSEYVLPICLSTLESDVEQNLIATGWGKTEVNGARSNALLKVDLEYFPNNVCREAYADVSKKDLPEGVLADSQVCAGSKTDQRDTCQGDSGGPLQINTDKLYLIGITSIGKMCGLPNIPAIYTRVLYYIPWIEGIVWKNE